MSTADHVAVGLPDNTPPDRAIRADVFHEMGVRLIWQSVIEEIRRQKHVEMRRQRPDRQDQKFRVPRTVYATSRDPVILL